MGGVVQTDMPNKLFRDMRHDHATSHDRDRRDHIQENLSCLLMIMANPANNGYIGYRVDGKAYKTHLEGCGIFGQASVVIISNSRVPAAAETVIFLLGTLQAGDAVQGRNPVAMIHLSRSSVALGYEDLRTARLDGTGVDVPVIQQFTEVAACRSIGRAPKLVLLRSHKAVLRGLAFDYSNPDRNAPA